MDEITTEQKVRTLLAALVPEENRIRYDTNGTIDWDKEYKKYTEEYLEWLAQDAHIRVSFEK